MFWVGNDKGMDGFGILLSEKWMEADFDVKCVSDRIMLIKLDVGKTTVTVLSVHAPQACLDDSVKDLFYENLQWTLTKISASEILFVCGDFNGHIGKNTEGYEGVHGVRGFGRCKMEGERILEFVVTRNLVASNSFFTKRESHLITYQSGENQSQIDCILVKQQNIKLVRDVKVNPNEEWLTQHKLIVKNEDRCKNFVQKQNVWKLQ